MAAPFDANSFLVLGFEVRNYDGWERHGPDSQIELFRSLYGTSPSILAIIWQELLITDIPNARLRNHSRPVHLLLFFRWMRGYETEKELKMQFGMGVEIIRNWCREMAFKVSLLRAKVVSQLLFAFVFIYLFTFSHTTVVLLSSD